MKHNSIMDSRDTYRQNQNKYCQDGPGNNVATVDTVAEPMGPSDSNIEQEEQMGHAIWTLQLKARLVQLVESHNAITTLNTTQEVSGISFVEDRELLNIFVEEYDQVKETRDWNNEGRNALPKLKIDGKVQDSANRILTTHLKDAQFMDEVVDAVYAMGRAVARIQEVKLDDQKSKKKVPNENRRERKKNAKIKSLRQLIAKASNELHRKKIGRKATKKEKAIIKELDEQSRKTKNKKALGKEQDQ